MTLAQAVTHPQVQTRSDNALGRLGRPLRLTPHFDAVDTLLIMYATLSSPSTDVHERGAAILQPVALKETP